MKNPSTYYKVHGPNSWDFDTLVDYAYSFWILEQIKPEEHPHYAPLAKVGIVNKCNCPQFLHYHWCKHAIGYALYDEEVAVPTRFSTLTVGKRKAPEGAKPSKRTHCLAIDYSN